MEDEVPLPYFREAQEQQQEQQSGRGSMSGSSSSGSTMTEERSDFQYHFLATIALRRLIARIHNEIHECERGMQAEPLWQGAGCSSEEPERSRGTQTHYKLAASTAQSASKSFDDYGGPPVAISAKWCGSWTVGGHYCHGGCSGAIMTSLRSRPRIR